MNPSSWIRFALLLAALILCASLVHGWIADRRERAALALELAATKKLLADAESRQQQRDAALATQLAQVEMLRRSVTTPSQIVRALPQVIPLPTPITLQLAKPESPASSAGSVPGKAHEPAGELVQATATAVIPAEDLKPLYDFALDCKACQAKLAAAQADLGDEKTKTQALARERDDALKIAKGGSFWRRTGRAAKWFAIGAAAGAIAAKASH